jgi:SAM-dependent methyltransferase
MRWTRRSDAKRSSSSGAGSAGVASASNNGARAWKSLFPSYPPAKYLGQLDPAYQSVMAARRAEATFDDCIWYHSFDMPDGRVVDGAWDLRGGEADYLGHVDLSGKRVLELGPAAGYLSFYMEKQGADVVAFDAGLDVSVDLLPVEGRDLPDEKMKLMTETIDRNQNAWWYMHRAYKSSAKFVQGNIYDMPADLGTFDVSLVGAILLHLREPWGALLEAARRTTECMIVTEPLQDREADPSSNIMRFSPSAREHISNWWNIYPGAVVKMLERLGFGDVTVTFHDQTHHLAHDMEAPAIRQSMYTIVGRPSPHPPG